MNKRIRIAIISDKIHFEYHERDRKSRNYAGDFSSFYIWRYYHSTSEVDTFIIPFEITIDKTILINGKILQLSDAKFDLAVLDGISIEDFKILNPAFLNCIVECNTCIKCV